MRSFVQVAALAAAYSTAVTAIQVDLNDPASIRSASSTVAHGMMSYYTGNQSGQVPGLLPQPYYWWECGAMMGSLIDYWYYTGDDTYNDIVTQALLFQVSPTYDFMPPNQTKDEGNDDQMFWAYAAMTAAEYKFPDPPADQPQWLTIAEAVFNSQAFRWDNSTCNGGLHWQIFQFNNGYNYKNAPSNAGFVNLGARLYAYTGNDSYSTWVERGWDWMYGVGLISPDYIVYDGVSTPDNCSSLDHDQWTYTTGILLNTAAVMWNITNSTTWQDRAQKIWTSASEIYFTTDKIMLEGCESKHNCDTDQLSFKSYLARFMAASSKSAPWLWAQVQPYLEASANAAAGQCSGGSDGVTCGTVWTNGPTWDGSYGVGQQMCAMQILNANLVQSLSGPVTGDTGGTSKGNATYGTGGDVNPAAPKRPITTADRAGAGIVTTILIVGTVAGSWWLVT